MKNELRNALLNVGKPNLAEKCYDDGYLMNFTKSDIKELRELVVYNDNYYVSNWLNNKDRKSIVKLINDFICVYRVHSIAHIQ